MKKLIISFLVIFAVVGVLVFVLGFRFYSYYCIVDKNKRQNLYAPNSVFFNSYSYY